MTGPDIGRRREIRKVGDWPPGSLLGALGEQARDEFLGLGRATQLTAGETLALEGDRTTDVFLLLDACVKIMASIGRGKAALLGIRVGGDLVGESAALDGRPRTATATAAGHCLVRVVQRDTFLRFLGRFPEVSAAVRRSISAMVRSSSRRRAEFGSLPAPTRLARVLAELVGSYGRPVREGTMIGVSLTPPELAGLAGTCDPVIHDALTALRRAGILGTDHRGIVVHDPRRLRGLAGFGDTPWDYEVSA